MWTQAILPFFLLSVIAYFGCAMLKMYQKLCALFHPPQKKNKSITQIYNSLFQLRNFRTWFRFRLHSKSFSFSFTCCCCCFRLCLIPIHGNIGMQSPLVCRPDKFITFWMYIIAMPLIFSLASSPSFIFWFFTQFARPLSFPFCVFAASRKAFNIFRGNVRVIFIFYFLHKVNRFL